MQLSKHFKLEEFTKSMTATRKGIKNDAGAGDIKNLENLCYEVLEPVRAKFDKPITITSGYRSEELCEAIGSKKTSQHLEVSVEEIYSTVDQIIDNFIRQLGTIEKVLEFYNKDDEAIFRQEIFEINKTQKTSINL